MHMHPPRPPWVHTCVHYTCVWDVNSSPREEVAEALLTTPNNASPGLFPGSREPSRGEDTGNLPDVLPSVDPPLPTTTNTSQVARRPSLPGSRFDAPEGATPQAPPKIGHPSPGSSSPGVPSPLTLLPGGFAKSWFPLCPPARLGASWCEGREGSPRVLLCFPPCLADPLQARP